LFFSSSSFSGCFELNSSRHYNWKNVSPLVVEPEKEATNFSLLLQFNSPIVRKVHKIPRKRRRRKEKDLKKINPGTEEKDRQEIAHPNLNLCFVSHS
jgi:hypothetical protein